MQENNGGSLPTKIFSCCLKHFPCTFQIIGGKPQFFKIKLTNLNSNMPKTFSLYFSRSVRIDNRMEKLVYQLLLEFCVIAGVIT